MNFPFIKQHDSMQCGIACLGMICLYYGKSYSLETLSRYCYATNQGVSMLGISQSAQSLGLSSRCIKTNLQNLANILEPCILHWNQNHFVVLYGINKKGKYIIADPAKGVISYDKQTFLSHWSGEITAESKGFLMMFEPTTDFYTHSETNSYKNHSFRFIFDNLKELKGSIFNVFVFAIIASCLQFLLPFFTQIIVDKGISERDISLVYLILAGQFILTLSRTLADFVRNRILLHIGQKINLSILDAFFNKLLMLPMRFFDIKLHGDLYQRMSDHERIKEFLTEQLLSLFFSILSVSVFCIVLLNYSIHIFLVFLGGTLLYGFWLALFFKKRRILDFQNFEQQAKCNSKTYQLLTYMQEIKLQGCENRRRAEWSDTQKELYSVNIKKLKLSQIQEIGSVLINETKNLIITIITATAVTSNQMSIGMMIAIQYVIGQLNAPTSLLMQFAQSLQDVKVSLERINEVHEMNPEDKEKSIKQFAKKEKDIIINNLFFKYDPHAPKTTLYNINAYIPEKKITAIVGASGSGKTTLLKLLLGYYPPNSGNIYIGGSTLQNYNMKWWRSRCSVVMQEGVIFSDSIARNIAINDENIDWDRLNNAAKIACADEFIQNLPLNYRTKIGKDGLGLSKGQQQRILIARAVYKQPDFIMLDEATNSLDAKNERNIVENLTEFFKNKTVIVIAHRLSTVKNADNILVMNNGRIIEQGTHLELTSKKGEYYNLIKNQLELGDNIL